MSAYTFLLNEPVWLYQGVNQESMKATFITYNHYKHKSATIIIHLSSGTRKTHVSPDDLSPRREVQRG